jgi:hypothetical protein
MNVDTLCNEDVEGKRINAEWRFLARRVLLLCDRVQRTGLDASRDGTDPREASLQKEAFLERSRRALQLIEMIRIGNDRPTRHLEDLRRLVAGLECSRSYFDSGRLPA